MLFRTHLLLVHDSLIPNITPSLDPRFRPGEVCLLAAPAMHAETARLTRLLRDTGIDVSEWPIADPWDIEHVRERVSSFVAERRDEGIVLNVSGGTLPMSLAAYEVFRSTDQPVYYVHPTNDHLVWLHPNKQKAFDLADRIRLPAFLAAHDLRLTSVVRQGITEQLRTLTATLVAQVERFAGPLATLNWYAAAAARRDSLLSPPVSTEHLQRLDLAELLDLFAGNGVLQVDAQQRLVFADNAARFYANGGWLEEHVFGIISQLRREQPTIQDLGRSLIVEWDEEGSSVKNEIDVAFLANNRLYLIECKTKRFDVDQSPEAASAATLYKLDTLRNHLGGDEARAMLVSYRGIGTHARARAMELGIEVCEGDNLGYLASRLTRLIGNACFEEREESIK